MNIVVYTCITKNYDALKIPSITDDRIRYFCFTDTPEIVLPPWEPRSLSLDWLDAKDKNRYVKMFPFQYFKNCDLSIYLDGNIKIVGDISTLIEEVLARPEDIFLYSHPQRKCIYLEAAACAHFSHDWIWTIAKQMRRYAGLGFPANSGLFEANVLIRKDTSQVRKLMDAWWREYSTAAKRDQLSLPFVAWHTGTTVGTLGISDPRFTHRYFRLVNHPPRLQLKVILRKYINRLFALLFSYERLFQVKGPLASKSIGPGDQRIGRV